MWVTYTQADGWRDDPEAFTTALLAVKGVQENLKGPKLKIESDYWREAHPH